MPTISEIRAQAGRSGGRKSSTAKTLAARANAALGGASTSQAKVRAARENAKKGGRPKNAKT